MPAGPDVSPRCVLVHAPSTRVRNRRGAFLVGTLDLALELSDTARFVWRQVDGARTVGDIGRLVAAEYGIAVDDATRDTVEFLAEMVGHGLLRVREQAR